MIERFQPVDWYDDKRKTPKLYRDMDTGEEITLYEYRKRRRAALAVDEGDDEDIDDGEELETQAYAEPAPRPRLFSVSTEGDKPPPARRMGIAEMLGPAVAGFATSVALIRLRDRPSQLFVPPREVTDGLLRPVGRIIDRHLPIEFSLLMGEDGKDVANFITASAAGMAWFQDAMRAYEEVKANERAAYSMDGRPARNTASAPLDAAHDWPGDILRRAGAGAGATANDGVRANGAGGSPRVSEPGDAEAAQRVHDLFSAAAEGRMRRGLEPGQ